jgi:hypothetical protein
MAAYEKRRLALIRNLHINIFKGMMAVSTLGVCFTFQNSISPQAQPSYTLTGLHLFSSSTANAFVAIALILFLITLGGSAMAALALSFGHAIDRSYRPGSEDPSFPLSAFHSRKSSGFLGWDQEMWGAIAAGSLFLVLLFAFIFCCLAVAAFCPIPGIAGVMILAIFMIGGLIIWIRHLL